MATTSTTSTGVVVPSITELEPVILTEGGVSIAPTTVTSHVYDPETGKNVDDILTEILEGNTIILFTKTLVLEATYDGQCVFNLTYPIENYNIEEFPIIVMIRNQEVNRDYYTVNINENATDQLIINNAKITPLKTGETVVVIFHYADKVYNGAIVNAHTINNITIIDDQPSAGSTIPDNTIFFDFANSQITYYRNGVTSHFKIGSIDIIRASYTINTNTTSFPITIPGYDTTADTLLIYENSTYIAKDSYYTIDAGMNMRKTSGLPWLADANNPIIFDFVVYKNATGNLKDNPTPSVNVVIPSGTIDKSKLTPELQTYMDEIKTAADDVLSHINNAGLQESYPINQLYNSNFNKFNTTTLLPDYWTTTGKVSNALGKYCLYMTSGQYCYALSTGESAINLNTWATKYTRISFRFTGVGSVKVSVYSDNKLKNIRKFSDASFSTGLTFNSTDKYYWKDTGTIILEPGTSVAMLHLDCLSGEVFIKEVMIHPIIGDINVDYNYKYSDGMNSTN